jgi:hypothetical protein
MGTPLFIQLKKSHKKGSRKFQVAYYTPHLAFTQGETYELLGGW